MKTTSLIIIVLLGLQTGYLFAQFNKGDKYVNGGISFNYNNRTDNDETGNSSNYDKSVSVSVGPGFGIFISKNMSAGVGLGYTFNKRTIEYPDMSEYYYQFNTHAVTLTGHWTCYKFFLEKFAITGTVLIPFVYGKTNGKTSYDDPSRLTTIDSHILSAGINVSPGFLFLVNEKLGITTSFGALGYTFSRQKQESVQQDQTITSTETNHSARFSLTSSLSLGIKYFFRKKSA